jgi:hypothetical protein
MDAIVASIARADPRAHVAVVIGEYGAAEAGGGGHRTQQDAPAHSE